MIKSPQRGELSALLCVGEVAPTPVEEAKGCNYESAARKKYLILEASMSPWARTRQM